MPESDDFDSVDDSVADASTSFSASSLSDGAKSFIKQNSPGGYNPHEAPRDIDAARRYSPSDDDPGCIGSFEFVNEYKPFKSREATELKGESVEIFEPVLYVRIVIRGTDKNIVHRPAKPEDKARFPYSWQEFNRGEKAKERGAAIQLLGLDISIIRHLAAKNVFTVEDMAAVSDNNLANLGLGARELRKRAQEFLDARRESPVATARVNEQQSIINQQAEQLAKATALIERLTEQANKVPEPKKRGRPLKNAPTE